MRLLHYDALGRLVLTDFRGKTTPRYAILSHRWSDSEALIEDISSGTYKEKEEGYRKLRFCANQAVQDGLQYFWIDTCCIDRWNNNERSKAINSMFQWYKNAARCYVFLSDVSVSTATEPVQPSDWEASFRASAWFTRGWTLQELIAPVSVEFFSRERRRIGDKKSLDQLIHDITNIPLAALRNRPLHEFNTSERRRWVETRRTKEEEDIVYCLLGILGVSMPTAYGEGQESARSRLQAELEETNNAPSIIQFSQNPRFVGRESQLAELEAKLFSNEHTTTTLAIVGPGGTGKTQLALEVAHRTRQKNKNCSVLWMDASDEVSLYQSYASVAQKLNIAGWDDDQADIKQLVKRCVVEISARHCLLIFDNTEHITLQSSGSSTTEAADLANCLPQSKLCSVIFTTTNTDTARALAPQNIISLRELTLDAALKMLQVRLARPLANTEQQEAEHLLRALSYLPLAVMQAAACIKASGMTVQDGDLSEGKLQGAGVKDPVAATLFLSIYEIRRDNALAADYLFLVACVERKDISLDLLEAASPQAREDAIRVLDKYALVTRRPAESALDVHRLVHRALRKQLQAQGLKQWTQCTITQLLRVFPDDNHSNRSKWRRLLPHAQYALSHSQMNEDDNERLHLAWKCAMTLHSDGRYEEAEELFVQVMETRKTKLGADHPSTLTSIANLASTYWNQGRWNDAEKLNVQVMETRKTKLGAGHPSTLNSMANLASTYRNQGRWDDAEKLEVQVMETRKTKLGADHPSTLNSMANLASTYWNQGRWNDAEKLNVQVMETRKTKLGADHPDTLTSIANLASTYRNQGRWDDAEKLFVQVMETRKTKLGADHRSTLNSMANLASTYRNQGRWDDAEKLFVQVQVMKTSKTKLGADHPDTLNSMANLASTYRNQGRWNDAEKLEVQVMKTRKTKLGAGHPSTLNSMANLASTYGNQGRWNDAEKLEVQVMKTSKTKLGADHPDTLNSIANLASTYWNQGRWNDAEKLNVQVMETRKTKLGADHPSTLNSMHNLAFMLQSQARHVEALALIEKCFQSRQQVLGEQHPYTQSSFDTLNSWRAECSDGNP
ncbi:CDC6, Cdc6-related protein, AAA superfamily ATPase [Pyrenophora tritici-repentis]|nr:CDC6, Cdc6-related protein, AAA superfamily ATPase [Pyrenophora tritici-repentis]